MISWGSAKTGMPEPVNPFIAQPKVTLNPADMAAMPPSGFQDPRFGAANRALSRYGSKPAMAGPMPVLGGTPRGRAAIGGSTWAPGAIPLMGADGKPSMTFGGATSWGGTHDDGYRIGPGNKTGDGKFHDTFGHAFDKPAAQAPAADKYGVDQRPWGTFADGGPTTLPMPKPDNIPAKLGADEFVMDRPTVLFHGLDKLQKMQQKAKEGLAMMATGEDADERTEPHGMADMREDKREGEMDDGPVMKMAEGGLVPSLEDIKFQGYAARAAADNAAPTNTLNDGHFLAPWERDKLAADARREASGIPDGVRSTDWRRFQRSPQGMAMALSNEQRNREMAAEIAARRDQDRVRWQQRQAEFNQGIALNQAERAAADQQWKDRQAISENYRRAADNERIGTEAAMKAAQDAARLQQPPVEIPGSDHLMTPYGLVPKSKPDKVPAGVQMMPLPGTDMVVPTLNGRQVSSLPVFRQVTEQGPFPEGLQRRSLQPMEKPQAPPVETIQRDGMSQSKQWDAKAGRWIDPPTESGGSGGVLTVTSQKEYDALKPGQTFVWKGKTLTKGAK